MKTLILFLAPLIALAACSYEKSPDGEGEAHEEHAHAAKHDGTLIALGDHEGFLEFKLDHDAGALSVWVYMGEEMTPASLDAAPVLNMKTEAGPKQLTGKGSGGTWTFRDEVLKGEPEEARFRILVGGKTYSPEWEHDHDEEEGHEDHDDD